MFIITCFFSFDFYVTPAFSIRTINTIGLCVVGAELSEALVSRPRGASDPSSSPNQKYLGFIFDDSRRITLFLFVGIPDE